MSDFNSILNMFENNDPENKLRSLNMLGGKDGISEDDLRRMYFTALGDNDWRVRKKAVELITSNPCQKDIIELISALGNDTNAGKRNSAQEALALLGENVLPYLHKELKNSDQDVRKFVVDILGLIKSRSSVGFLIKMLDDPNPNIQLSAVEALGVIGDRRVIDPFINLLKNTRNDWLRFGIIEAIGNLKDNNIFDKIEAFLEKPILVKSIMNLYSKLGDAGHIHHIIKVLKRGEKRHIRSCIQALQGIKNRLEKQNRLDEFIRSLSACNGQTSTIFREFIRSADSNGEKKSALLFLGYFASYEDLRFIISFIEDMELHETVVEVIKHNISQLTELDYIELLSIQDYHIKRNVLDFAPYFRSSKNLKVHIMELLNHPYGYIRGAAVSVLKHLIDNKNDIIKVIPLVNDRYPDVQEFAIETLIEVIKKQEDIKEFGFMLINQISSSPDPVLRANSAKILKHFPQEKNIEALKLLMKDEAMEVRREAIKALLFISESSKIDFNRYYELGITDEDRQIRIIAANGILYGDRDESLRILHSSLNEEDPIVRAHIFRSLFLLGNNKTHGVLKSKLETENPYVIITLLEDLPKKESGIFLSTILEMIKHEDNEVRKAALSAYYRLKGEESLVLIKQTLNDAQWDLKASIIEILYNINTLESLMILSSLANDKSEDLQIRKLAVMYIIESCEEDAILSIIGLLMDTNFFNDIIEGLKNLKYSSIEKFTFILENIKSREIVKSLERL